ATYRDAMDCKTKQRSSLQQIIATHRIPCKSLIPCPPQTSNLLVLRRAWQLTLLPNGGDRRRVRRGRCGARASPAKYYRAPEDTWTTKLHWLRVHPAALDCSAPCSWRARAFASSPACA